MAFAKNQDYAGKNFSSEDFDEVNISGCNFTGANLREASFYYVEAEGANFEHRYSKQRSKPAEPSQRASECVQLLHSGPQM